MSDEPLHGELIPTDPAYEEIDRIPWEENMTSLANGKAQRIRVPRTPDLKRRQVINAFTDAFALIGGVPRLALWADENPTEFYRLYAKLMPKQEHKEHDGTLTIKHALPRGALDG